MRAARTRPWAGAVCTLAMLALLTLAMAAAASCTQASSVLQADGLGPSVVAAGLQADYDLFASRCSKCHALSRALNSGIDDDSFWKRYVERMRRQPASGISVEDEVPILRFLHFYSAEVRRAKEAKKGGLPIPVPGVSTPTSVPMRDAPPPSTATPSATPSASPPTAPPPAAPASASPSAAPAAPPPSAAPAAPPAPPAVR